MKGVKDAQKIHGKLVNPNLLSVRNGNETVKNVDFDVAVSVEEKNTSEGGAKISVLSNNIGGKISGDLTEKSMTRIKFSVPLKFGVEG